MSAYGCSSNLGLALSEEPEAGVLLATDNFPCGVNSSAGAEAKHSNKSK